LPPSGYFPPARVGARIDRELDAIDHLALRDDFLSLTVPAALGLDLILDAQADSFDDFAEDPEQCVAIVTGAGNRAFCCHSVILPPIN
jgi:hypothetical protein